MYNLKTLLMKSRIILMGLIAVTILSFESCTKNNTSNGGLTSDATLTANLTAAIAVVASTELNKASTADIQSLAVTNFDSIKRHHSPDFLGMSGNMMRFNLPHISSCATVTVSGTTFPKTITIDYGSGCTSGRGPKMTGKIIITQSDTLITAGAVKTIAYQNVTVDSMKIEYSGTITNLGKNLNGNWVISSTYTQKTTGRNGDVVTESYSDSIEWISGFGTADKSDDVFYKTGTGTITINDTLKFKREITKPLLYDNACGNIKSGTIVLTKGSDTIVTDYGDGTCDTVATVTTNGTTETIDLSTFRFPDNGHFDQHCHGGPHHGPGPNQGGFKFGF
jgi:hypothetical protein